MKRYVLVALGTALVAGTSILSPVPVEAQMRVGVIGGANISGAWGDAAEGADTRTGFDVGALLQLPVGGVAMLQPELHYTQKGYVLNLPAGASEEWSLDYLQVPVLLAAGAPLAEGFDVNLMVGPSLGILLSCEREDALAGGSATTDCTDSRRSLDWGILFGGSFAWAAGAGDILVDVRYDLGMTEVSDADGAADLKNTNFQFLIGYAAPLGH